MSHIGLVGPGTVCDAFVPFNDTAPSKSSAGGKRRPVVIIGWSDQGSGKPSTVLIVPITSHGDGGRPQPGEIQISNAKDLSLKSDSFARPYHLMAIHSSSFDTDDGIHGRLEDHDFGAIVSAVAHMFVSPTSLANL